MTCRAVTAYLVDLARGISVEADRRLEIDRHLRECRRCAVRLEEERAVSAGLGRLARATGEPAPNPEAERALLAAFDSAWAQPHVVARWRAWQPLAAAAVVVLAALGATGAWTIANRRAAAPAPATASPRIAATAPPVAEPLAAAAHPAQPVAKTAVKTAAPRSVPDRREPAISIDASAFVPWPGADTLPTFESGRLMRLDLPTSVAISLGLNPPASQTGVVRADILVGQDGLARAVRVAP